MRESNIGSELKEMAQEVVRFGERCVQAGRDWLNERREDMNNRNDDGRHDYPSGQGYGQARGQRESSVSQRGSQYGRGAQSEYEEQSGRSGRMHGSGQYGAQQASRARGEYYGGSQFDERMQSTGWDEDRSNWEYEGGPERFGSSGYSEAGQSRGHGQQSMRQAGGQYGSQYGGQRESGLHGQGSGDYYGGRQGYAAQQGSYGSEYNTYGRSQGYGEGSGYTRSPQDFGRGGQRAQGSQSGGRSFGGWGSYESAGYASRGATGSRQDYLDEGEMSGYGGRELGSQQLGSSSTGRYGTAPGQYGYGGYGTSSRGYRGIGPKNYTRSDERLTEEINERLTDDDDLDASEITVRVVDGKVTLEGSVDQRWMKHRAEDIADACNGVKEVDNRIQVSSGSSSLGQSQTMGGRSSTARSTGTTTGTSAGATGSSGSSTSGGTTPH